ncbi:MAG: hypothetical protein PVI44_05600 [Balneolaceae bacterium]|jgi:hypothetical protein
MNTADYNIRPTLFERLVLQPLGLQRDNALVIWLLLLISGITIWGFWYFDGDVPVVLVLLYWVGKFVLSFLRVDFSFYVLAFNALVFDQFPIPKFSSLTYQISYFKNLQEVWNIPELRVINSFDLHLLILILAIFFILSFKKGFGWKSIPVFFPFLLFFFSFLGSMLYSLENETFWNALWGGRAIFYFFVLYLLVPQIVRTKNQVRVLFWFLIVGISVKAFQAIVRFIEMGFTTGGLETLTNREDPVIMVTLLIFLIGLIIFNVRNKQRLWLCILLVPLLMGFYFGMQLMAYASFFSSLVIFFMILPAFVKWKFTKYILPFFLLFGIYGAIFWRSDSILARPVQIIKYEISKLPDYTSYFDRNTTTEIIESLNFNPILGIGFNKKDDNGVQPAPFNYELNPIPNQFIWILVRTGFMGFLAFWYFFNVFASKGIKVFLKISDPYLKVIVLVIITAIINQMVASCFDFQVNYYRNMIYLGCLMGLLPAVEDYVGSVKTSNPPRSENVPKLSG